MDSVVVMSLFLYVQLCRSKRLRAFYPHAVPVVTLGQFKKKITCSHKDVVELD